MNRTLKTTLVLILVACATAKADSGQEGTRTVEPGHKPSQSTGDKPKPSETKRDHSPTPQKSRGVEGT